MPKPGRRERKRAKWCTSNLKLDRAPSGLTALAPVAPMIFAHPTLASAPSCVVSNTNAGSSNTINSGFQSIPEFVLIILNHAPQRESTEVGHLNHAGESAVHEEWRLDNVWNLPIQCSISMELSSQLSESRSSG